MIVNCNVLGEERSFDTERGLDLSIELHKGYPQVNCFNAPLFSTTPLREGSFVGSTLHGSPVNFYDVAINPHGNGTHTECVGHIAKEPYYINECYKSDFHVAQLISIFPLLEENGDKKKIKITKGVENLDLVEIKSGLTEKSVLVIKN